MWTCKCRDETKRRDRQARDRRELTCRSIESYVLDYLGSAYNSSMVTYYISENFTSQDYLLPYVELNWQANLPDCPI